MYKSGSLYKPSIGNVPMRRFAITQNRNAKSINSCGSYSFEDRFFKEKHVDRYYMNENVLVHLFF
jgi:hypothetical protein